MRFTIADLKKGEKGIITDSSSENIPLKLLEMGCLPGNEVHLLQLAPFSSDSKRNSRLDCNRKNKWVNS
jgi:ferrous iron transport protein A